MHLLILGKIWPEPASSAAGSRLLQLISAFREQGWQLSFATAANASEHSFDLKAAGITTYAIELNASSFDTFLRQLQPTAVLFDRFTTEEQFGWRIAEHCPNALRLLDTEDLHGLRYARQQALKQKREVTQADLVNTVAMRELASIYRCDLSLIISTYEIDLLKQVFKVDPSLLHYIPFLAEPLSEEQVAQRPSFEQRRHFISLGNFLHAPNLDAVLFLKEQVWPQIRRQLPQAILEVYGAYVPEQVVQLHDPETGFLVKGRAERVEDVMRTARICLAPLRFGAGLKGKLLDAMRYGTPSVTTAIGAEGMHGELPWGGSIADQADEMASAAVFLYNDPAAWEQARQQGDRIFSTCFVRHHHTQNFIDAIQHLSHQLEAHRLANFTGAMLMQQSAAATKYMALWIEAKNK